MPPASPFGSPPGFQADCDAVASCYANEVRLASSVAAGGGRVLVGCDGELTTPLAESIRCALNNEVKERPTRIVDPLREGISDFTQYVGALRRVLDSLRTGTGDQSAAPILFLRGVEFLAARALHEPDAHLLWQQLLATPGLAVVGFCSAPAVSRDNAYLEVVRPMLSEVFLTQVRVCGIHRRQLVKTLWSEAAAALASNRDRWTDDDTNRVYQVVGDLNVVELRAALGAVHCHDEASDPDMILARVRELAGKPPLPRPARVEEKAIGGYQAIKDLIRANFILPFKLGQPMARGILFHGPPGTGKTFFARWLATELKAYLTIVRGPELKGRYYGETEQRIRDMFLRARENQPAVIVMDEFDALGGQRDAWGASSAADASALATLLSEMDGLADRAQVVVFGTTNRKDRLDTALLDRRGRIEYIVAVDYPTRSDARDILRVTLVHGSACERFRSAIPNNQIPAWVDAIVPEQSVSGNDLYEVYRERGGLTGDDLRVLCERIDRPYGLWQERNNPAMKGARLPDQFAKLFSSNAKAEEVAVQIRDLVLADFIASRRAETKPSPGNLIELA